MILVRASLGLTTHLIFLAIAIFVACCPAFAQIDCWIDAEHPTTADLKPMADPNVAPLRRSLRKINMSLHALPELQGLPRTRLRSTWQVGGQWDTPARSAHFLLRDHRESMWVKNRCDVIAGADRIGPLLSIVVSINAPNTFFESDVPEVRDDQFAAWREPQMTGKLRGRPVFGGRMLVFTRNGKLPWVPVTTGEYLDFTERELQRKLDGMRTDEAAAHSGEQEQEQEQMLARMAEGIRRTDPANAERLIAELRAQHKNAVAGHAAAQQRKRRRTDIDNSPVESMLRRVRAWRADLSAEQLTAQARLGLNGLQPADVPPERYALLAKPDPVFPWDRMNPTQPQMIRLEIRGGDRFEQPMQRVMETLDMEVFEAMVSGR